MDYYMSIVTVFMVTISSAATLRNSTNNDTINMEDLRQSEEDKWESFAELFYGVIPIYIIVGVCLVGVCCVTLLKMNLRCGRSGHEHLTTIIQESGPSGGLVIDYPLILMDIGGGQRPSGGDKEATGQTRSAANTPKNPDDPECPLLSPENPPAPSE